MAKRGRYVFRSQTVTIVVGGVLFTAGAYLLHEAWEGRGQKKPILVRPFLPV